VIGLGRPDLELTDSEAVKRRFERDQPEVVIHCAAMSRGPLCEAEPDRAWRCNVEVVRQLRELCGDRRLLLMSTDLVFDGRKGGYREDDEVNPLTVYARTKVAAEELVRGMKGGLVVRTSLNHGRSDGGNRGFNEEMLAAWRAGRSLKLFTDEYRNPIGVPVTVRALWELAGGGGSGVLHVAGAERLSRWEIGERLAEVYGVGKGLMERTGLKEDRKSVV
jgi:dTDP-4-dehydrorhamnose reductase